MDEKSFYVVLPTDQTAHFVGTSADVFLFWYAVVSAYGFWRGITPSIWWPAPRGTRSNGRSREHPHALSKSRSSSFVSSLYSVVCTGLYMLNSKRGHLEGRPQAVSKPMSNKTSHCVSFQDRHTESESFSKASISDRWSAYLDFRSFSPSGRNCPSGET